MAIMGQSNRWGEIGDDRRHTSWDAGAKFIYFLIIRIWSYMESSCAMFFKFWKKIKI